MRTPPFPPRALALCLLLSPLAACDLLGPSGPEGPGYLDMELISPHDLEGAALFRLVGGAGLGEVTCEGGEAFYQHHGDFSDVVIVLEEPGRIRFRVATNDVAKKPEVTVVQVAGGDNVLRSSLSEHVVELEQVEGTGGGAP